MIKDGIRYLMKMNLNDYGQQSVNEKIACRLHERLGWENYSPYTLERLAVGEEEYPYSLNPLFTSAEEEFVSGYQLIRRYKIPNNISGSGYEAMIQLAVQYGIAECEVRRQLEYTIFTDFILSNTDRHFNNFGFLYHAGSHRFVKMAPIFDSVNALFFNQEIIPSGNRLLEIRAESFCKREVDLLRYVTDKDMIDLDRLRGYSGEAEELLKAYTNMPEERIGKICRTIEQKTAYLRLFQEGRQIWKKEKYW